MPILPQGADVNDDASHPSTVIVTLGAPVRTAPSGDSRPRFWLRPPAAPAKGADLLISDNGDGSVVPCRIGTSHGRTDTPHGLNYRVKRGRTMIIDIIGILGTVFGLLVTLGLVVVSMGGHRQDNHGRHNGKARDRHGPGQPGLRD